MEHPAYSTWTYRDKLAMPEVRWVIAKLLFASFLPQRHNFSFSPLTMSNTRLIAGEKLSLQVESLARSVLAEPAMSHEGKLRFFKTPGGLEQPAQIQHVLDRINGTYAASNVSIVQRMPGTDTTRMLRAPVCLLERSQPSFASTFIQLVQTLTAPVGAVPPCDWSQPSDDGRLFPVAIFREEGAFLTVAHVHATQSIPFALDAGVFADSKGLYSVFYLTELQKLTLMLLLLHTAEVRKMFTEEAKLLLKKHEGMPNIGCWLDPSDQVNAISAGSK